MVDASPPTGSQIVAGGVGMVLIGGSAAPDMTPTSLII
jgi:hypothetical protein